MSSRLGVVVRRCRELGLLFRDGHPLPQESLASLADLVNSIRPEDVHMDAIQAGVNARKMASPRGNLAPVLYTDICEGVGFSIGVFTLTRADAAIPLHDHPGITGFIKVMAGLVTIDAYSWRNQESTSTGFRRKGGEVVSEGRSSLSVSSGCGVVEPERGNLHSLSTTAPFAAFFDVLIPDYDPPHRDCIYYRLQHLSNTTDTTTTDTTTTDTTTTTTATTTVATPANPPRDFWTDSLHIPYFPISQAIE